MRVPGVSAISSPARGASARRTRVEKLPRSRQSARRSECAFDTITETAKFPDHLRGAPLRACSGDGRSAFIVDDPVMEDLPDKPTEPVRDRPNRLRMTESDHETSVHEFKDTAFGLHRGVRGLIEQATHLSIAVG